MIDIDFLFAVAIYGTAIFIWSYSFYKLKLFKEMKTVRALGFCFALCLIMLTVNLTMEYYNNVFATMAAEEGRFNFLDHRATLILYVVFIGVISISLIYRDKTHKIPVAVWKLYLLAIIAIIGFMAPIIWIPPEHIAWLVRLRTFQTASYLMGLNYALSAMVMLFHHIMRDFK